MSERYREDDIDRLLNATYCPSVPLKGVIKQLRADLALNVIALHELQAGAARDREEIAKLREALRRRVATCEGVLCPELPCFLCESDRKLLGEGEK